MDPQDLLMNILTAQCMPRDRVWNGEIAQKCERCGSKNLPCGPNLLREDDPEVFIRRTDDSREGQPYFTTGSPYDTTSTASPSEFSGGLTTGYEYQSSLNSNHGPDGDNTGMMSIMLSEVKEGDGDSEAYHSERLKVEALARYTTLCTLYGRGLIGVIHQTDRTKRLGRIFDISV